MKALDLKNKILDDIVSDLKRPDFLVCNEGKERYWLTDGTASDMSRMRATAHLELMVKRRYEAAMKKAGAKLLPLGAKKLTGIAGSIVKYALSENVIQEALECMPGWRTGLNKWDGQTYLVKRNLAPLPPVKGDWADLRKFIETLFGLHAEDEYAEKQLHAFYCLVRAKLLQMSTKDNQRGSCPMLILMSGPNTGKTLLMRLLAQLLGNTQRAVDPSVERNGWSDACLRSPVLFYDEASREDYGFKGGMGRERFAEHFKGMEFGDVPDIAKRGNTATSWPAVWLWARSVNPDSRASILQTPVPTENGMSDKLIIARVYKGTVPLAGKEDPDSRSERLKILTGQLPAFHEWLRNSFPIERKEEWIRSSEGEYRNQAHPFAHPDAMEVLNNSENDTSKATIMQTFLETADVQDIVADSFVAGDLYARALSVSVAFDGNDQAKAFTRIFDSAEKVGRILSQMARDPDSTVTRHPEGNTNRYRFDKPES